MALHGTTETYRMPAELVREELSYVRSQGGVIVGKPYACSDGMRAVRVFWRD